jgi:hypothetical protein
MISTIVYETATGVVLACGDVSVDYSKSEAHDGEGRKTIGGGDFDNAISVATTNDDISQIEPLEWRYLPRSKTFEKIIHEEEGMRIGDE